MRIEDARIGQGVSVEFRGAITKIMNDTAEIQDSNGHWVLVPLAHCEPLEEPKEVPNG